MASLNPIKLPHFLMPSGHLRMDQMYGLNINDHQLFPTPRLRRLEQELITALPWILVLIICQTKDTFQEFRV